MRKSFRFPHRRRRETHFARLDAGMVALPAPIDKPRLLGELEFQTAIGAVTRASYQRAFNCRRSRSVRRTWPSEIAVPHFAVVVFARPGLPAI
jgi:hypothetical protein